MKKLLLSLLAAGLFAVPSISHAASNPYVSLSGGLGLMNNSTEDGIADYVTFKTGYVINGAVGLKTDYARLEAEVGYHRNVIDTYAFSSLPDADISLWSFMANGYLDYEMKDSGISPYIMAGIGCASLTWDEPGWNDTQTVFAWQIGAGVGIKAGDKATVDLGYRYFKPSDVTWKDDTKNTFASSNILVGVRIGI